MASSKVQFHQKIDTKFYADSVEWCPVKDHEKFLVCGTYQLVEDSSERRGGIHLYRLDSSSSSLSLSSCCQIDGPGVLDMKWRTRETDPLVGLVNAAGELHIFDLELQENEGGGILKLKNQIVIEADGLGLALDWSGNENEIVASCSSGKIVLVQIGDEKMKLKDSWKAHDYETWTCAIDVENSQIVYSGGDDALFKAWDLRVNPTKASLINKEHSMGVTNIQSNKFRPNILCTGSYDERLRVWDLRSFTKPIKEVNVGGGIWRIKNNPFNTDHVAVAAMYNGFHVLSLNDGNKESSPVIGQDSLAYGIDWSYERCEKEFIVASCSFYDHSLQLWSFSLQSS